MVDVAILAQVFLYRENTARRKKSEGPHLNCWLDGRAADDDADADDEADDDSGENEKFLGEETESEKLPEKWNLCLNNPENNLKKVKSYFWSQEKLTTVKADGWYFRQSYTRKLLSLSWSNWAQSVSLDDYRDLLINWSLVHEMVTRSNTSMTC